MIAHLIPSAVLRNRCRTEATPAFHLDRSAPLPRSFFQPTAAQRAELTSAARLLRLRIRLSRELRTATASRGAL